MRFPQQAGFEPVKTPAELAKERGEEPPKRLSLLEASLLARQRRQQAQAQAQKGGNANGVAEGSGEHAGEEGEIGLIFGENNAVGVTGLPKLEELQALEELEAAADKQSGKHRKDEQSETSRGTEARKENEHNGEHYDD